MPQAPMRALPRTPSATLASTGAVLGIWAVMTGILLSVLAFEIRPPAQH